MNPELAVEVPIAGNVSSRSAGCITRGVTFRRVALSRSIQDNTVEYGSVGDAARGKQLQRSKLADTSAATMVGWRVGEEVDTYQGPPALERAVQDHDPQPQRANDDDDEAEREESAEFELAVACQIRPEGGSGVATVGVQAGCVAQLA